MSPISFSEIMINKDFPADHPYSSHISRYAVFPTFQSPEDAKRGVQARREQPINAEMPATAYDVQIIHKTKGIPNLTSKLHIVNDLGSIAYLKNIISCTFFYEYSKALSYMYMTVYKY